MSLDALVAAHGEELAVHAAQLSRINAVLGISASVEAKACPGCRQLVAAASDGSLPPHQIDGALLGSGRRRSASVCRYRPEAVTA